MEEFRLGSRTLQPYRQLLAEGTRIPVGKKALDILSVLADADGEIVTKDELLEAVWQRTIVEENALQVHIVAVRKALGPEACRLRTIRGVGYQLVADRPGRAMAAAEAEDAPRPDRVSVVVVPFTNMSGESDQAYFADGISEDIATDLSKVSSLTVISGRLPPGAQENACDAKLIAQRFQASHVLEGSIRKFGNRIRITAQLIDGKSAAHIWAERYDREMADIFALQDELTRQIVDALKLQLLPGEMEAMHSRETYSPDAYDYYLQARALRATMDLDCLRRSVDAYRNALRADPEFARAWAGLATALMHNRSHFGDESGITDNEIRHALDRATRLAPDLPDVLASRAQYSTAIRDWDAIDDCIARFRQLDQPDWSVFSHLLLIRGYPEEAAAHQRRVHKSDPLSAGATWALQFHLACAGRYDEAEFEYRKSMTLPSGKVALDWEAAKRAIATGNREHAREKILEFLSQGVLFGGFGPDMATVLEQRDKALEMLKGVISESAGADPLFVLSLAHLAVYLEDGALALDALRIGSMRSSGMLMEIWHPIYAGLRNEAAFKSLLVEIGLIDHCRRTGEWGQFLEPAGETDFTVVT